jgi:hypothetical protein
MPAAVPTLLDRRAFLRLAGAASALAVLDVRALRAESASTPVRLVVAVPEGAGALRSGAHFGLEEVEQAATLLRREVEVGVLTPARALAEARAESGTLLVGACRGGEAEELADAAAAADLLYLNAGDDGAALRARCLPTLFHVAPGAHMLAAARALAGDAPGEIVPWHPALRRFGAGQLNDRYLVRFDAPMPAEAWAVWMGVKIAWEASLRARSTRGEVLAAHLLERRTRFDGHKGAPLTFRADRQLRQPLYLAAPGSDGEPRQLPDLRGGGAPDEELDRLHTATPAPC